MALADNHIHFLFGVDDGAKDEEVMHAIYMYYIIIIYITYIRMENID